ncbi:hypothetical protein GGR56DRAFT_346327 [Xylariaceae sp. FL0804]|nr:hypothetical protein GGR56DRAFT_346327 [Xylariaceae sp. FL0804]
MCSGTETGRDRGGKKAREAAAATATARQETQQDDSVTARQVTQKGDSATAREGTQRDKTPKRLAGAALKSHNRKKTRERLQAGKARKKAANARVRRATQQDDTPQETRRGRPSRLDRAVCEAFVRTSPIALQSCIFDRRGPSRGLARRDFLTFGQAREMIRLDRMVPTVARFRVTWFRVPLARLACPCYPYYPYNPFAIPPLTYTNDAGVVASRGRADLEAGVELEPVSLPQAPPTLAPGLARAELDDRRRGRHSRRRVPPDCGHADGAAMPFQAALVAFQERACGTPRRASRGEDRPAHWGSCSDIAARHESA